MEIARANEKSICQQWQLTLIREGMTYQTLAKREPIPTVIEPTWRYRHSNPTLETIVILSNYHTYNSLHNVQPASQSTLGKRISILQPKRHPHNAIGSIQSPNSMFGASSTMLPSFASYDDVDINVQTKETSPPLPHYNA
jgi:hypothetical protein